MAEIVRNRSSKSDTATDVVVIGGGACGLVAALRAKCHGADVVVLERDPSPSGSTGMSTGFIPAAETRFQRRAGIADTRQRFVCDIMAKADGGAERAMVESAVAAIGPALEWLCDAHGFQWALLDDFLYPGHSAHRMHSLPERTGEALMQHLIDAAEKTGVTLVTKAHADALALDRSDRVEAVRITRPDGHREWLACAATVLACGGFAGNPALVGKLIPRMASAPFYGHAGNKGDALSWAIALDGDCRCLDACQGHGSLAHPHNILVSWALMMAGGIQLNAQGSRFSNEHLGYSEQAETVLRQPGGIAWCVFDDRLRALGRQFPDFCEAEAAEAVRTAGDAAALAAITQMPPVAVSNSLAAIERYRRGLDADPFGRDFTRAPGLVPPYHAIRVTGALFHTQGGVMLDEEARLLTRSGKVLPNLFAGGGAACGVSGHGASGYLSGNGLLAAIAFGYLAGRGAARCRSRPPIAPASG